MRMPFQLPCLASLLDLMKTFLRPFDFTLAITQFDPLLLRLRNPIGKIQKLRGDCIRVVDGLFERRFKGRIGTEGFYPSGDFVIGGRISTEFRLDQLPAGVAHVLGGLPLRFGRNRTLGLQVSQEQSASIGLFAEGSQFFSRRLIAPVQVLVLLIERDQAR